MQKIEFTPEEIKILHEVLEHQINEVEVEVFRTDTHDFKEMLKHRRQILEKILAKLSAAVVAA